MIMMMVCSFSAGSCASKPFQRSIPSDFPPSPASPKHRTLVVVHALSGLDGDPRMADIRWATAFVYQMISNALYNMWPKEGKRMEDPPPRFNMFQFFSNVWQHFEHDRSRFPTLLGDCSQRRRISGPFSFLDGFLEVLCLTSCWSRFAGMISWLPKN